MSERPIKPKPDGDLIEITRLEDIPQFASEEEEHRFWSTHALGAQFFASVPPLPPERLPLNRFPRAAEKWPRESRRGSHRE